MPHVTLNQAPAIVSLGGMGLIARGHVLTDTGGPVVVKYATVPKTAQSVTRKTVSASVVQATLGISVTNCVLLVHLDKIAPSFAYAEKVETAVIQYLVDVIASRVTMAQCVIASAQPENGDKIVKSTVTVETAGSVTSQPASVAAGPIGREKSVNFLVRR